MNIQRQEIGALIKARLLEQAPTLRAAYQNSISQIGHFVVDDLLPLEIAQAIYAAFPSGAKMRRNKSLREHKYIAAQMDRYDPLLEEAIFAFQEPGVVSCIREICGMKDLYPDEHLYAGGISVMEKGNFLNPHLDNSHNNDRKLWRVMNLLYYVSPDWTENYGGNLELWPGGVGAEPVTIVSSFNRLAVMATHQSSWHSVSPIKTGKRCCVSNYYFSSVPLRNDDRFHITSFRGRPEQRIRDFILRGDAALRMIVRRLAKGGIVSTSHIYKRYSK